MTVNTEVRDTFLATYKAFTTASALLHLLVLRYLGPDEEIDEEEYAAFRKRREGIHSM